MLSIKHFRKFYEKGKYRKVVVKKAKNKGMPISKAFEMLGYEIQKSQEEDEKNTVKSTYLNSCFIDTYEP